MTTGLDVADKSPAVGFRPPMVYVHEEASWEYKRLDRDLAREDMPTEEEMNALGAQGWELTGVISQPDKVVFYLKRLRK